MRKFLIAVITAFAAVAACGMAVAHTGRPGMAPNMAEASARLTGDMAQMLAYHPVDGASRSGEIRRALNPTAVQPH